MKDQVLDLFEISYKRIKQKTEWTMEVGLVTENYLNSNFKQEKDGELIPFNYVVLMKDARYSSYLFNLKDSQRGWYKKDVIECLDESEQLIGNIQNELLKFK